MSSRQTPFAIPADTVNKLEGSPSWNIDSSGVLQFPPNLGGEQLKNYVLFDFYETDGSAIQDSNSGSSGIPSENNNFINDAISRGFEGARQNPNSPLSSQNGGGLASGVDESADQTINAFRSDASSNPTRPVGGGRVRRAGLSVALPIPAQLNVSYGFDYEEVDFSGLITLIEAKDTIIAGAEGENITGRTRELSRKLTSIATGAIDDLASVFGSEGANVTQAISAQTREAANHFKEQVFKGVERRTFSFKWSLSPRNKQDAVTIKKIVYAFKKYSHPERSEGGLYLKFPGEFKIGFMSNGKRNDYLFRIGMCGCTKCEVTYGGNELMFFKQFEDSSSNISGSSPDRVTLSLDFTELEILTREEIEEGY